MNIYPVMNQYRYLKFISDSWGKFYMAAPEERRQYLELYFHRKESLVKLAKRFNMRSNTSVKWRSRISVLE